MASTSSPPDTDSAPSTEGIEPHPITPEHVRLARENSLIGQLHDAFDAKNAAVIRRLVREYRDEFPKDEHLMQAGFEIIASCLDGLDPSSRAAAQHYYDQQRASTLRRYIRRTCLEPP